MTNKEERKQKLYDPRESRLLFIEKKATALFWDNLWSSRDILKEIEKGKGDKFVSTTTKKFLPPSPAIKILEGGCGKGLYVYSLARTGYDAYGVDFAENTVAKINQAAPDLKISLGDVRDLPFSDDFFDGYWSLGVIEHFFSGYTDIASEMARVIKPGGYLFLTFPYMSPFRKIKARMRAYATFLERAEPDNFYQFALDDARIRKDFETLGFSLVYRKPFDGIKGLKEEGGPFKPVLQKIYGGKSVFSRLVSATLSLIVRPVSSHAILLVFKKI